VALIKEAEARATLAEREAWEWVSEMEVESAASLASAHREADGFTGTVALLEGKLTDACQAPDTSKVNF
jgi:hypothetical protein